MGYAQQMDAVIEQDFASVSDIRRPEKKGRSATYRTENRHAANNVGCTLIAIRTKCIDSAGLGPHFCTLDEHLRTKIGAWKWRPKNSLLPHRHAQSRRLSLMAVVSEA